MRAASSASLAIPEFGYFPLSCSDAGHSSPESGGLNTPGLAHGSPLRHAHSLSDRGPNNSLVFAASSLTRHALATLPKQAPHASNRSVHPLDVDSFSCSFPAGYEEHALSSANFSFGQHDQEPQCHDAYLEAKNSLFSRQQASGMIPNVQAALHSPQFPPGHLLNPFFARTYLLEDELGSGGYGFVMTARHRTEGHEVAVKFIIKEKVPEGAWMEDDEIGRLPIEVMLLSFLNHENIVKCLDLFEDYLYFYLVQELHGSPWSKASRHLSPRRTGTRSHVTQHLPSLPLLSPSVSEDSLTDIEPYTPPQSCVQLHALYSGPQDHSDQRIPEARPQQKNIHLQASPSFSRRPSHDLFECIEHNHLSENQVRYIFSQVVEAVYYLDSQGITHRDIKDENIVIDKHYKVKLIDFGSAIMVNPNESRPWYNLFFGTAAYAAPEILLKKWYQAAPAEIWTLGILLSYLLTGAPPFATAKDAIDGRIVLTDIPGRKLSRASVSLMRRCLDVDPKRRADIKEVRGHRWLRSNVLN